MSNHLREQVVVMVKGSGLKFGAYSILSLEFTIADKNEIAMISTCLDFAL